MDRVALIGIIVQDLESTEKINKILHEYSAYIIGRMGIPYRKNNISIISVVVDAPQDIINAMSGRLGKITAVNTKTVYAKTPEGKDE